MKDTKLYRVQWKTRWTGPPIYMLGEVHPVDEVDSHKVFFHEDNAAEEILELKAKPNTYDIRLTYTYCIWHHITDPDDFVAIYNNQGLSYYE